MERSPFLRRKFMFPRKPVPMAGDKPQTPTVEKYVVCKFCGHVNTERLYCEKCSMPLSITMLREWLLQKYFEALVMNAEAMKEIVQTYQEVEIGDVRADYVIEYADGSKTVLVATTRFEDVLTGLIKYNANKGERMEVVFIHLATENAPRLKDELIQEAYLHNIRVRFFSV